MGVTSSRPLTAQSDARTYSAAVSTAGKLELELGEVSPKLWELALKERAPIVMNYRHAWTNGTTALIVTRNHWPKQVVHEYSTMPPSPLETKEAAHVTFSNADGQTVAMLLNDTSPYEQRPEYAGMLSGYYAGFGRSVLYAASPDEPAASTSPSQASDDGAAAAHQEELTCRFCLQDEDDASNLIWPCDCTTPVHRACLARWRRQKSSAAAAAATADGSGAAAAGVQCCEVCRAPWPAAPLHTTGSLDGKELHAVGEIRPVLSVGQALRRGYLPFMGGLGLFPARPDGTFASEPELVFDPMSSTMTNARREHVGRCVTTHGATAGTRKLAVAEGVDALLLLALSCERDANCWGGHRPIGFRGSPGVGMPVAPG